MFLGNLSAATERKVRKAKVVTETTTNAAAASSSSTASAASKRCAPGDKEVLYSQATGLIPKEVMKRYLEECVEMLLDDSNIREIINDCTSKSIGLHQSEIEFQRDVMEYNFQIERNYGCYILGNVGDKYPDDPEMVEHAKEFMLGCMKGFIKAIKVRSTLFQSGQLQGPLPNQSMSRASILEFFEACNALMGLPDTQKELRQLFLASREIPNERVVEMQRNLLKLLGYHPDFAVSCLNKLNKDFANDREVMMKMQFFMLSAELACRLSTLEEAELADFYKDIPPLLHYCPQVHIMKQRMMAMQQEQMQQQQPYAGAGGVSPEQRAQDVKALQSSGLLSYISTPDGRLKVQELSSKVQSSRARMETIVADWNDERKQNFFESFADSPVMAALTDSGDPAAKMQVLLGLSDADLDDAMSLLIVLQSDDGKLMQKVRAAVETGGEAGTAVAVESPGQSAKSQAMHGMVAALSSLDNMRRFQQQQQMPQHGGHGGHGHHDHSHGRHEHEHGPGCNHHAPPPRQDVSKNSNITMER
jgi:hypothetical protein